MILRFLHTKLICNMSCKHFACKISANSVTSVYVNCAARAESFYFYSAFLKLELFKR
jgi:hypothetical protein